MLGAKQKGCALLALALEFPPRAALTSGKATRIEREEEEEGVSRMPPGTCSCPEAGPRPTSGQSGEWVEMQQKQEGLGWGWQLVSTGSPLHRPQPPEPIPHEEGEGGMLPAPGAQRALQELGEIK